MRLTKRLHVFFKVVPFVAALALLKLIVAAMGLEFMPLDGLIPSLIAGAIFLLGFLLTQVLADYREAEHMPGEVRTALEAIHDDVLNFSLTTPASDMNGLRNALINIVEALEEGLGVKGHHSDLGKVVDRVDELSPILNKLQTLDMSERYVVRLKAAQDTLRRSLFRIGYMQKIEFIPSVQILVRTLVVASLFVLLLLKTGGGWEAMLILIFVSYMFVYLLFLIDHLDQPFRTGEGTVDDVSLFQLREFKEKILAERSPGGEAVQPLRPAADAAE